MTTASSEPATKGDLERLREAVEQQLVAMREECQRMVDKAEARAVRKAGDRIARRLS